MARKTRGDPGGRGDRIMRGGLGVVTDGIDVMVVVTDVTDVMDAMNVMVGWSLCM